jgi:pilus assembly protein CpaE
VRPRPAEGRKGGERGSASVELVGVLPFLVVAVLVAAQLAMAGASLWSASFAARAGARASLVGGGVEATARAALPPPLRRTARIDPERDGAVVEVQMPRLLPGLPPVGIEAETKLGPDG